MARLLFVASLCLFLTAFAYAQPDPNQGQNQKQRDQKNRQPVAENLLNGAKAVQQPLVQYTPQGLFVLRNGILAKFQPTSLEPQGAIELLGPLPVKPNDQNDQVAMQAWLLERGKRQLPPAMITVGNDVLVILGESFIRVNSATMTVKVQTPLIPANAPQNAARLANAMAQPVLELQGQTLYVVRGSQLLAVSIADGSLIANALLPEQGDAQKKARRAAKRKIPENAKTVEITVVGTLMRYPDAQGKEWALEDQNGDRYVLTGDALDDMLAPKDQPKGTTLRITGTCTEDIDPATRRKGLLEVKDFQILQDI